MQDISEDQAKAVARAFMLLAEPPDETLPATLQEIIDGVHDHNQLMLDAIHATNELLYDELVFCLEHNPVPAYAVINRCFDAVRVYMGGA